jgi:ankyrin repeat protein
MLLFSFFGKAQDSKELYQRAKTSFENGEINPCLQYLENCQQVLGGSNAKIESLKCQALVMKSDWINAGIAYKNYERLLPSSSKYGEAYSVMLDIKKEIWNELENIEKKKKEKVDKEINEDLIVAKEQEKNQELNYNSKIDKINKTNEKLLFDSSMESKDKELLTVYKNEIKDSGSSNLDKVATEIKKHENPTAFLLPAVKSDDLKDFIYLLSIGADINWINQNGESLLHLTIVNDAIKIYNELIKNKVDIEFRDYEGNTPLIKAIIKNKMSFFNDLAFNKASFSATNSVTQQPPLYYSLINDNSDMGLKILKNNISPNDYFLINNEKYTPLYLAVSKTKSISFAALLLRMGAEIDKVSYDFQTPLMAAVDDKNIKMVNFLLNNGANVNFQDEYKQTVLHLAVRNNDPEMVLYLIQRGGASKKIKDTLRNNPYKLAKHTSKSISKIIKKNKSLIDIKSDYRNNNHENQYLAKLEKINKRQSIINSREDRFSISFVYDTICNYGVSMGTLNQKQIGFYFTARANENIFESYSLNGTVDNKGTVTGGQYANWGNDWRFTNTTKVGIAEGVIGLTKKITYPLWIYAGAGVTFSQTFWEMDLYDNLGDYEKTDWVKNTDEQVYKPLFESGLIIDLSGFNIRAGAKTEDFNKFIWTAGIGFSLSR